MLRFFFEGRPFYESLKEEILNTKISIDIELYYFASDDVGWEFANLLIKKSQEKIKIRLLCDHLGCRDTDSAIFESMKAQGIEVKLYNPLFSFENWLGQRDHRKLIIIDNKVGFLGGFNMASEYFSNDPQNPSWRDTGASITREELVHNMTTFFEDVWNSKKLSLSRLWPLLRTPNWEKGNLHVVPFHGWFEKNAIRREYYRAIKNAQKNIYITSPYFIPDRGLRRILRIAARRKVDVRILTAGLSDVPIVQLAGRSTYSRFLKAGVKIYEYQKRVLHAKSAIIDGEWFTIGTSNFDHLSFFRNLEINLFGKDKNQAQTLTDQFSTDLKLAHEIMLSTWKQRPWWHKLTEKFLYFFRRWM